MMLHPASRILCSLIMPGYEEMFGTRTGNASITLSPVQKGRRGSDGISIIFAMELHVGNSRWMFSYGCCGFPKDEQKRLVSALETNAATVKKILCVVMKSAVSVHHAITSRDSDGEFYYIDLVLYHDSDKQIRVILPVDFLRHFSRLLFHGCDTSLIDREVLNFFKKPLSLFPGLRAVLETFSHSEIQEVITVLKQKCLLTPYQLCLIILALPDMAPVIKRSLSSASIMEVIEMMRRLETDATLGRRDLAGGVYSVEEAIFHHLHREERSGCRKAFSEINSITQHICAIETLNNRDFSAWLDEIESAGLLYQTISAAGESCLISAIASEQEKILPILKRIIPEKRVRELEKLAGCNIGSFSDTLRSRSSIVGIYRNLKVKSSKPVPERCEYLLFSIMDPEEYNRVLLEAGWFPLSTALKSCNKKTVQRVLSKLYIPARCLIEDVLKGVLNPSILHDEMQIKKAQSLCVSSILSLHERGVIALDL